MAELLRRSLAPITPEAWEQIDEQAVRSLKANLSGRYVVDFVGPLGWKHGAVNLGTLSIPKQHESHGVDWGVREVLPLVELRVPFKLKQLELDNATRGAEVDLDPLVEAAKKIASFEETAIYEGFKEGNLKGLLQASTHKPVTLTSAPEKFVGAVAQGLEVLREATVEGPYALILGPDSYKNLLQEARNGYPVYRVVEKLLPEGKILWSPTLQGGVLLSLRGGDFELTVGQDLSVGYCCHDRNEVELYFTETLAFRVLEPEAAVVLKASKS